MINTSNIEQAKKEIKKSKGIIVVKAQDDNFNRKILEYGKFNILIGVEMGNKKNSIRQVDSGMNHILANIATKNKIAIGTSVRELSKLQKKEKAAYLEKLKQNINIYKKAKTKIKLLEILDKRNSQDLLLSLGASTAQAKDAVNNEL